MFMGKSPTIVVIGASAGGVEAIRFITARLPADFAAAVFIVLHVGAHKSQLPSLLNQEGPLPAVHAKNGALILTGHIYIAPPDHHLVIEPGHMLLTKGPRENWARPAVDPLFRGAAQAYGPDVIGVILTGGLGDGTAGLHEIKERGGITVVQDPNDAADPGMPRSALRHVSIDHCLPLARIPELLVRLVARKDAGILLDPTHPASARKRRQGMTADYKLDQPVAVTCPDCGGALRQTERGSLTQFTCHIGHVYTAEVMMAAQFAAMEWTLGATMRSINERAALCGQMADKARTNDDTFAAARWDAAAREARERTIVVRRLLEEEWTHPGDDEIAEPSGA